MSHTLSSFWSVIRSRCFMLKLFSSEKRGRNVNDGSRMKTKHHVDVNPPHRSGAGCSVTAIRPVDISLLLILLENTTAK